MLMLFMLILSMVIRPNMSQSDNCNTTCSPFKLLVIWHTSNGEDSAFIEQRRFVIRLLLNIPQGTEIQVTAINTQPYRLLHFQKNTTTDWIYNISMYSPEILKSHSIEDSLINEMVFNSRKQNDKKKVAELVLLIVSEKTLIEKSLKMIKDMKKCVVFTGLKPPPPSLASVATDKQHLVMINSTFESIEENINGPADTVLDLLCRDSRLICDTDKFWTGKRCVSCSYICSADTKKHPDICLDLCPCLDRNIHSLDRNIHNYGGLSLKNADIELGGKNSEQNHDCILMIILVSFLLFCLILIIQGLCIKCYKRECLKRKDSNQKAYRTTEKDESSPIHRYPFLARSQL